MLCSTPSGATNCPETGAAALHSHISRLRRTLGPAADRLQRVGCRLRAAAGAPTSSTSPSYAGRPRWSAPTLHTNPALAAREAAAALARWRGSRPGRVRRRRSAGGRRRGIGRAAHHPARRRLRGPAGPRATGRWRPSRRGGGRRPAAGADGDPVDARPGRARVGPRKPWRPAAAYRRPPGARRPGWTPGRSCRPGSRRSPPGRWPRPTGARRRASGPRSGPPAEPDGRARARP